MLDRVCFSSLTRVAKLTTFVRTSKYSKMFFTDVYREVFNDSVEIQTPTPPPPFLLLCAKAVNTSANIFLSMCFGSSCLAVLGVCTVRSTIRFVLWIFICLFHLKYRHHRHHRFVFYRGPLVHMQGVIVSTFWGKRQTAQISRAFW